VSARTPGDRVRGLLVAAVVVAATAGVVAVGLGAYADHVAVRDTAAPVPRMEVADVEDGPRVVFRSTAPGAEYGRVAMVPLADPVGPRAFTDVTCERVDVGGDRVACLRTERGVVTTFAAQLLDEGWRVAGSWPLAGLPSRTRLSDDGALVATTTFVTGHSYAGSGFSTRTEIRSARDGEVVAGDLEELALLVDGRPLTAADRNLWGVTFAGGDAFYATAASGGRTWLVRGDLAERTLTAVRPDAECPSISPDGTRLAYKKDRGERDWGIAVLDLETGEELILPEARSVDDQLEWLDDETLLYGLPRPDEPGAADVWSIRVDPSAEPRLFLPHAWSPAVVRG